MTITADHIRAASPAASRSTTMGRWLPSVPWIGSGLLTIVAGLGHLNVVLRPVNNGHHIDHGARYVAFFLLVGGIQLVVGKHLAIDRSSRAAVAAVLVNLALILAYTTVVVGGFVVSATRDPEKITTTGLVVLGSEVLALMLAGLCLDGRMRALALNACFVGGVGLWVARLTGLL